MIYCWICIWKGCTVFPYLVARIWNQTFGYKSALLVSVMSTSTLAYSYRICPSKSCSKIFSLVSATKWQTFISDKCTHSFNYSESNDLFLHITIKYSISPVLSVKNIVSHQYSLWRIQYLISILKEYSILPVISVKNILSHQYFLWKI